VLLRHLAPVILRVFIENNDYKNWCGGPGLRASVLKPSGILRSTPRGFSAPPRIPASAFTYSGLRDGIGVTD